MEWWESLTLLQKIFVGSAIPSSLFIILSYTLSFDVDATFDNFFDFNIDDPLGIFNLRGFMSFLSIGGLTGYGLTLSSNLSHLIAIIGALISGVIAAKATSSLTNFLIFRISCTRH